MKQIPYDVIVSSVHDRADLLERFNEIAAKRDRLPGRR